MFRLITKGEDSVHNEAVYLKLKIGYFFFPSYTTGTSTNFYHLPKHFLVETFAIKKKKKITTAKGAQLTNLKTCIFPQNWYISGSKSSPHMNLLQQVWKESTVCKLSGWTDQQNFVCCSEATDPDPYLWDRNSPFCKWRINLFFSALAYPAPLLPY